MKDLKIKNENVNFKNRVCGIIIKDNKLLIVEMMNNKFYCLPGGHVKFGENSESAVLREIHEEVNFDVEIVLFAGIIENFFENKKDEIMHEIGYYYLLKPVKDIELIDWETIENDEGVLKKLDFKWIDIDKLNECNFFPTYLKNQIVNNNIQFGHHIIDEL